MLIAKFIAVESADASSLAKSLSIVQGIPSWPKLFLDSRLFIILRISSLVVGLKLKVLFGA